MNTTKAMWIEDRTPMTAKDIRYLNTVAAYLAKRGAASIERICSELKIEWMPASWALWHVRAKRTPADLWIL